MMAGSPLKVIGFDADDTLWENEIYYRLTEEAFTGMLANFADPDHLSDRLLAAERRNLRHYGFGIKGFTLSMIETAIEVTDGRVPARVIEKILAAGRELHSHPIEVLPDAAEALAGVAGKYHVVLITKGDLFDQERKLAQSGLGDLFDAVEIVSDKSPETYRRIFLQADAGEGGAMMIGNSVKSDVIPAIAAGGWGVHIPHRITWAIEAAAPPSHSPRFRQIKALKDLGPLIDEITAR
jgi:putative hydrolase of the HAD superfamily